MRSQNAESPCNGENKVVREKDYAVYRERDPLTRKVTHVITNEWEKEVE